MASSKLLLAAKALSADPGAPNAKNQLAAAARFIIVLIWASNEVVCDTERLQKVSTTSFHIAHKLLLVRRNVTTLFVN